MHERAPTTSSRKVDSIEEIYLLNAKVDSLIAMLTRINNDNVSLQDIVENNAKNVDVNFLRNFSNNSIGTNLVMAMLDHLMRKWRIPRPLC